MIRTNVIDFPGNDRPKFRRAESAAIFILPVVAIIRFPAVKEGPGKLSRRLRRLRNLKKLIGEIP